MRKLPLLLASALLALAPGSASAKRTTPQGFIGLHMEDPVALAADGVSIEDEVTRAAANGVESIRFPIYWSNIQPYASMAAVPASKAADFTPAPDGGAPFNFSFLDRFVGAAASKRIILIPTLMGAPAWADDPKYPTSRDTNALHMPIPADFSQFAAFAAALASRYGPTGSFWTSHPSIAKTPIGTWQIWNEPNFSYYWPQHAGEMQNITVTVRGKPTVKSVADLYFAPTYLDLVRQTRTALRSVDPNAKIMLASMANSDRTTRTPPGSYKWVDLSYIYKANGKGAFDAVAANLFTGSPLNLVAYLGWYRDAMKAGGDSKLPITVTEISWSGSLGSIPDTNKMFSLVVSPTVQANNLAYALKAFANDQKKDLVTGAFWHTWDTGYSDGTDVWDWTGLVQRTPGSSTVTPLPLLAKYKSTALGLQGSCKRKVLATDCFKS